MPRWSEVPPHFGTWMKQIRASRGREARPRTAVRTRARPSCRTVAYLVQERPTRSPTLPDTRPALPGTPGPASRTDAPRRARGWLEPIDSPRRRATLPAVRTHVRTTAHPRHDRQRSIAAREGDRPPLLRRGDVDV